jgi:hypothetical protein
VLGTNPAHANSGPSSPAGAREAALAGAELQHLDRVAAIAFRPLRAQLEGRISPTQGKALLLQMMRSRIEQHGSFSGDNNQLTPGGLLRRLPEWEAAHGDDLMTFVAGLETPGKPGTRMSLSSVDPLASDD